MRIKLDENLPSRLAQALGSSGHDVDTVEDEHLTGCSDAAVWEAAQEAGRFLITQDLDFSDIRKFAPGAHHGVLLVRLPSPGRRALFDRVHTLFETEDVESWRGCFVVSGERKIRVRRHQV